MKQVLYGTFPGYSAATRGYFLDDGKVTLYISPLGEVQPVAFDPSLNWRGNVDVVSILVWDEGEEVAFQGTNRWLKKPLKANLSLVATYITQVGVFKNAFVKRGSVGNFPYQQYIYVFEENSVRLDVLENLLEGRVMG